MRKASIIFAVLILSLAVFVVPVMAEETTFYQIKETPIDPADAFDLSKMIRTFTFDGVEYEDLSVVYARNNEFRLAWFSDYFIPKAEWYYERYLEQGVQPLPVTIEEVIGEKKLFVREFCFSAWQYPSWDIVSINGEPWQNTIYADLIIEKVGEVVKPSEPLGDRSSEAWAMFMDPRTNGASHVWFGDPNDPNYKGGPLSEVTDYMVDRISKHNPLNNGKPFDFNRWGEPSVNIGPDSNNEKEPASGKEPVQTEIFPNPEWQQGAVLVIGNSQVTIIHGGVTKMNILSVAPEIVSGRTMIPLRGVLDELGYELIYDGEQQAVFIKGQEQDIALALGKETALINGREIKLDQPAIIKDSRTLVPLRFVSENLGFEVEYDNGKITLSK